MSFAYNENTWDSWILVFDVVGRNNCKRCAFRDHLRFVAFLGLLDVDWRCGAQDL